MVPDKGAHKEQFDERLAQARDELVLAGESVVAEECGDQGQAVVLTDSRLIIVKAGVAATGTLNGRKTGTYPFEQIRTVSVRKGPMGAVIQVVGEALEQGDERPENVIVFSGADKVKRCEAMAAKIESALGKPIERIEPKPETAVEQAKPSKPKGGRVATSLAEEMYGENASQPADQSPEPVAIQPSEPLISVIEAPLSAPEPQPETDGERAPFRPNPNLPQPRRRPGSQPDKVMVLFGVALAIVLGAVAIVVPMRRQAAPPVVQLDVKQLTSNPSVHRRQYIAVVGYQKQVLDILKASNASAASVGAAIGSGNHRAVIAALDRDVTGDTWDTMSKLDAPLGLAGAKESIVSGLFIRKSAVEAAMTGAVSSAETTRCLKEADGRISKGLAAMDQMLNALQAEISGAKK